MPLKKKLHILGIRGIPAHHGGFETFAENLSLHLVAKDWDVTVYCQEDANDLEEVVHDEWQGVKRVRIPVKNRGDLTSVVFDWKAMRLAAKDDGVYLILGYNTGVFSALLRLKGKTVLFNMDGLEWKRSVWPLHGRIWLYINEWVAAWLGTHLIADHPEIKKHLKWRVFGRMKKITMIAYGGRVLKKGDIKILKSMGLSKKPYALVVARPVPENNIFEIVRSWSKEKRNATLVVLGDLDDQNPYHQAIAQVASDEVMLTGGIYDPQTVDALRFGARFYIHGHSVGGTNPSLVEALGAGNAVLAHDNAFNRWVAGEAVTYFKTEALLSEKIAHLLQYDDMIAMLRVRAQKRHNQAFQWQDVLESYEALLDDFV